MISENVTEELRTPEVCALCTCEQAELSYYSEHNTDTF